MTRLYHLNDSIKNGVAGWGDAATIIPWTLYHVYGDTAILRDCYTSMTGWVHYIQSKSPNYLWKARGYGDWYPQGDSTSLPYIDQCYFAHSVDLLQKSAAVLNKSSDAITYLTLLDSVKTAFLNEYIVNGQTRATSTQTAYALALAFDLLPDSLRPNAAAELARKIHENNDHLATGFLGTPYLLPVLFHFGYDSLAFTLLTQKTLPSWLYPITKGATTIWEKWDAICSDGSFDTCSLNHYAYGAVGNFLYRYLTGISPASPGYKKISIHPHVGGGLRWVKAWYVCSYGKIERSWKVTGKRIKLQIDIPAATSADVLLPDGSKRAVGWGKHRFVTASPSPCPICPKKQKSYDSLKNLVYAEIKNKNYDAVISLTKAMLGKYLEPGLKRRCVKWCDDFNYANRALELITGKKEKFKAPPDPAQIQL